MFNSAFVYADRPKVVAPRLDRLPSTRQGDEPMREVSLLPLQKLSEVFPALFPRSRAAFRSRFEVSILGPQAASSVH